MKFYIAGNQVCMKRGLDTERLKRYFAVNGCTEADSPAESDVIIAVTCAFISSYTSTAVEMIKQLRTHGKRMIVAGCLPDMASDLFCEVFDGEHVSTKNIHDDIDGFFPDFKVPFSSVPDSFLPDSSVMLPFDPDGFIPVALRNSIKGQYKGAPILRISEGCNNSCSYCSHPFALGRLKSKPPEECIGDYKRIIAKEYKRVTIHANDPASYGTDIGLTYPQLLHALDEVTPAEDVKWNLNDIHPRYLLKYEEEILHFIIKNRVAFIGVPVQSGSPHVLKLMNRNYDITKVTQTLKRLKESHPKLIIATHLIAGFPGETEHDAELTVNIFKEIKIDNAYIFRYSANSGTKAARLENQLSEEQISARQQSIADKIAALGCKADVFL